MKIAKKAEQLRNIGYKNSGQDSILAHITPLEASLLKLYGGSGRIDPETKLPHFDNEAGGDGWGGGGGGDGWGGGDYGNGSDGGDYGGELGPAGPGPGENSEVGDSDYGSGTEFGNTPDGSNDQTTSSNSIDWDTTSPNYSLEGYSYQNPDYTANSPVNSSSDTGFFGTLNKFLKTPIGKFGQFALAATNPALAGLFSIGKLGLAAVNGEGAEAMGNQFGNTLSSFAIGPMATQGLNMMGYGLGPAMGKSFSGIGDPNATSIGVADGLGGLASLYGGYKQSQMYKDQANSLSQMFSSNSPYATQLKQQLERRDAAAGRRSQYGPREVELQAKLAEMAAGIAPSRLAATQQYGNSMNQNFQNLAHLYKTGVFNPLIDSVSNGLGNLFIDESPYW